MNRTVHVPPTLEGRVMVELGATLARARADCDKTIGRLEAQIDTLEQQLQGARDWRHLRRRQAEALGYDTTLTDDVECSICRRPGRHDHACE